MQYNEAGQRVWQRPMSDEESHLHLAFPGILNNKLNVLEDTQVGLRGIHSTCSLTIRPCNKRMRLGIDPDTFFNCNQIIT